MQCRDCNLKCHYYVRKKCTHKQESTSNIRPVTQGVIPLQTFIVSKDFIHFFISGEV